MNTKLLIATFASVPDAIRSAECIAGMDRVAVTRDQVSWACIDDTRHGEPALLKKGLLEPWGDEVRGVYLYSRFAPCPACARELATLPGQFPAARFSLAFHVLSPNGSTLGEDEVRAGLRRLAQGGWSVRDGDPAAAASPSCSAPPPRAQERCPREALAFAP